MEPVAGLARTAVADPVGKDEVIAARVQRLALAEQFARELGPEEARAAAGRPVKDEDRVVDPPVIAAPRSAEGSVMDAQLRQRFPGRESEVADDMVRRGRLGILRGGKPPGEE